MIFFAVEDEKQINKNNNCKQFSETVSIVCYSLPVTISASAS